MFAQNGISTPVPPLLPSVVFKKNSTKLTKENKEKLDSIIFLSKQFPDFTIVPGYFFSCKPNPNKVINDRLIEVTNYLLLNGVDSSKVYLGIPHMYNANTITFQLDIINTSNEPPPHPILQKKEAVKPVQQ